MSEMPSNQEWAEAQEDIGYKAEGYLEQILRNYAKLGDIEEVTPEDFGKKLGKPAFFRTDVATDQDEGWDFGIYNTKEWQKVDLTIIFDPGRRSRKEVNNDKKNIKTLFIPLHVLKDASLVVPTMDNYSYPNKPLEEVRNRIRSLINPVEPA